MAVSQKCLGECEKTLLAERKKAEDLIRELAHAPPIRRTDYDEGIGFSEDVSLACAKENNAFKALKDVNRRLDAIRDGRFKGVCQDCRKDIEEDALKFNPMRNLCINCQRKENGKKR